MLYDNGYPAIASRFSICVTL